jgi:hypothetical protein
MANTSKTPQKRKATRNIVAKATVIIIPWDKDVPKECYEGSKKRKLKDEIEITEAVRGGLARRLKSIHDAIPKWKNGRSKPRPK